MLKVNTLTPKFDLKSTNENVDEMIKDMNREIHSIDEKNKVNDSNNLNK